MSNKVFVGNLSFEATRDDVVEAFSAAGKVVDVKIPTDRESGRPRGFAFVEFETDEQAQKSIELLNGRDLRGRSLRVNEAENRPPRPGAAGGGGDRPPRPYSPGGGPGGYRGAPPGPPPFGDRRGGGGGFETEASGRGFRKPSNRKDFKRKKRTQGFTDDDY